jgi:M3 family oligoendopeptidase
MPFTHYPDRPATLTVEFATGEFESLLARVPEADASQTADRWIELVLDWNALSSYCRSEASRIHVRLCGDFTNEEATAAEEYFREKVIPAAEPLDERIVAALLATPHRAALEERFGAYLFERLELARLTMDPVNAELRRRDGELAAQYRRLQANAIAVVNGETMTHDAANSLLSSPDRELRRAAFVATSEWTLEHRDELAAIFDELVSVRHAMARNLGLATFTPLGYAAMDRTDYGPQETAHFRRHVLKHFLPIVRDRAADHARRIGVEALSIIDVGYDPDKTLPRGVAAPVETQLQRSKAIFELLSPELSSRFERMAEDGSIDLPNRPGKYSGAFCAPMYDEDRCAVLLNSVGDARDVEVLLHEMGHAFQKSLSDDIELVDLRNPTADLAEIHSTTMEFLGMRHVGQVLPDEHVARYQRNVWNRMLGSLVSIARMDEFQHWIYENPEATIAEREAKWTAIGDEFSSGYDYTGFEKYRGTSWYDVGHLFQSPFYLIDYALAQLVAMQLALIDAEDHDRAMAIYLDLCRRGGSASFARTVEAVGLRSPFDESLIADLAGHVRRELSLLGEAQPLETAA